MELHAALKDRVPSKIDIGPVYNVDPSRRTAYSGNVQSVLLQRESGWQFAIHELILMACLDRRSRLRSDICSA